MKTNKQNIQASITQVQQWAGPLPSPDALVKYNEAVPGSAQKIIAMAEKEMEHRHQREDLLLKQENDRTLKVWRLALISTIFGFASVLILAFLIGFALYIGSDSIAVGTAIGAIAAVAGLFTFGQIMKSKGSK